MFRFWQHRQRRLAFSNHKHKRCSSFSLFSICTKYYSEMEEGQRRRVWESMSERTQRAVTISSCWKWYFCFGYNACVCVTTTNTLKRSHSIFMGLLNWSRGWICCCLPLLSGTRSIVRSGGTEDDDGFSCCMAHWSATAAVPLHHPLADTCRNDQRGFFFCSLLLGFYIKIPMLKSLW